MNKYILKIISFFTALLILLMPLTCSAASFSYPDGVSEEKAVNCVNGTDKLISAVLKQTMNTTLKNMLTPVIYGNETLSGALTGIYNGISANAAELKNMGIDVSVENVSRGLYNYPEVQNRLSSFSDWSEVNLDGVSWGVRDKQNFSKALSFMLSPFNDVLYALLCSGTLKVTIVSVKGGNGYENSIVPILNVLDCKNLISQEEFTKQADEDKCNMVCYIAESVLTSLEKMCGTPANSLSKVLPQVSCFIKSGKLNDCIDKLISPVKESRLVKIAELLKLVDLSAMTVDVEKTLGDGLTALSKENGFSLPEIDLELLASCGSEKDGAFVSDKGKAYIAVITYLFDALKANKDILPELMKKMNGNIDVPADLMNGLFSRDTTDLVNMVVSLFNPVGCGSPKQLSYPSVTSVEVSYTPNLTEENFKKVLDNIDGVIDEFVKEGKTYESIEQMLKCSVYTNDNINKALTGIYGMLEEQNLSDTLKILGIDITPSGVASLLKENGYGYAREKLSKAKNWKTVSLSGVTWNFYNGSRAGFENALCAILRPVFPLFRLLLAGEDLTVLDSIVIKGANGYDSSVIPVLEALGCNSKNIKTFNEYKKNVTSDGVVKEILNPVFDLLDGVFEKPVYTLTDILPNIVYFLNSGDVETLTENLLLPVTSLTKNLSGIVDMKLDTASLTTKIDLKTLLSSVLDNSEIKLPEFDINKLQNMGVLENRSSKSTVTPAYSYVKANQTGVLVSVLRVLAETLKLEENGDMLSGVMGNGGAMGGYSASIGDEFKDKTADEVIEWLYNLLFKDRVKKVIEEKEEYMPNIIYEAPKDYSTLIKAGVCVALVLAAAGAVVFVNRKRIFGEDAVSVR